MSGPAVFPRTAIGQRLGALPWKRLAVLAVATFAVALVVISGFERVAGRSVSSYTGGSSSTSGSTVPGVNHGDGDDKKKVRPSDDATPSDDPGGTPSDSATPTPSETATPSQSPSADVTPSPTTATTPTADATTSPTPSALPTP